MPTPKNPTKKEQLGQLLDSLNEAIVTYSQSHLHLFVNHLRDKGFMSDEQVLKALESFNESLDDPAY